MVSGIDILEVMNDLDDKLLLDARCYKKSSPVWLKIAVLAACFCCVVLMGILFAGRFTKGTDVPETLASVLEETVSTNSVFENASVVYSEAYDLDLLVPGEYAAEIEIDTPYIFTYKYITEVITLDHAAFSFAYSVENETGTGGYLWTICVYPKEEYDWSFLERFEENTYLLNKLVLATDDTHVYELNYPDAYVQFDANDYESILSYYRHAMVGYEMLSDFVERNGLDAAENGLKKYGDYINETVRTAYDAFIPDSAEIVASDAYRKVAAAENAEYILTSSQTDAVLSVSYEHIEDFEIDTPYPVSVEEFAGKIITFGFETAIYSYYDRTQRTHGYDGLVWQITTQPRSDLEQFYELDQDELCYMINVRLLGYDENYIYKLVCLGMLFKEDHQYDSENITSIQSYGEHMEYGITVLEDFIERNELQTLDNAIDWKEWYIREIMAPVKAYME